MHGRRSGRWKWCGFRFNTAKGWAQLAIRRREGKEALGDAFLIEMLGGFEIAVLFVEKRFC